MSVARVDLSAALADELVAVEPPSTGAGRAEAVAALRVAGAVYVDSGLVRLDARLTSAAAAHRLAQLLVDVYDCGTPAVVPVRGGLTSVQLESGAEVLGRLSGLLDRRGRPVEGMPPALVSAACTDRRIAQAALRGAVLAGGRIERYGGFPALRIYGDDPAAVLAVCGFVRRLGATAVFRERHLPQLEVYAAAVREFGDLTWVLAAIGAPILAESLKSTTPVASNSIVDACNAARLMRGADLPEILTAAAELRLAHPTASLAELARLSDPPATANAIASRLRRLVHAAALHQERVGVTA